MAQDTVEALAKLVCDLLNSDRGMAGLEAIFPKGAADGTLDVDPANVETIVVVDGTGDGMAYQIQVEAI